MLHPCSHIAYSYTGDWYECVSIYAYTYIPARVCVQFVCMRFDMLPLQLLTYARPKTGGRSKSAWRAGRMHQWHRGMVGISSCPSLQHPDHPPPMAFFSWAICRFSCFWLPLSVSNPPPPHPCWRTSSSRVQSGVWYSRAVHWDALRSILSVSNRCEWGSWPRGTSADAPQARSTTWLRNEKQSCTTKKCS